MSLCLSVSSSGSATVSKPVSLEPVRPEGVDHE